MHMLFSLNLDIAYYWILYLTANSVYANSSLKLFDRSVWLRSETKNLDRMPLQT